MTKILAIGCVLAGALIITGYMYSYEEPEQTSIPVDEQTSIQRTSTAIQHPAPAVDQYITLQACQGGTK